jgi:hypothetical protein
MARLAAASVNNFMDQVLFGCKKKRAAGLPCRPLLASDIACASA